MLIQALLTPRVDVHYCQPDDTLENALAVLEQHGFTTFPVIDGSTFLGVISRRRIFEEYFRSGDCEDRAEFLRGNLVKNFIATDVEIVSIDDLLGDVLFRFLDSRYDFLPVLSDGRFIGIITRNAMLSAFIKRVGLDQSAHKMAIVVTDFRETITKLTWLIAKQNADILGVACFEPQVVSMKFVEITVRTDHFQDLMALLEKNGFSVRESQAAWTYS